MIVAAVVIALTDWQRADAVASLVIGALIVPRTVIVAARERWTCCIESTPTFVSTSTWSVRT